MMNEPMELNKSTAARRLWQVADEFASLLALTAAGVFLVGINAVLAATIGEITCKPES